LKHKKKIIFLLASFFVIFAVIKHSENSICRTVECMRLRYEIGDRICYYTTDSYSMNLDRKEIGEIAKSYFNLKNMILPIEHTTITNSKNKVIALLEGYSLFPFTKDAVSKDPGCSNIE
jgi:hypothetical protein